MPGLCFHSWKTSAERDQANAWAYRVHYECRMYSLAIST